jgi:hypothetical protein
MSNHTEKDTFLEAWERYQAGLPAEAGDEEWLETFRQLKALGDVAPRSAQRAAEGKAAFLKQADDLKQAVSVPAQSRHTNEKAVWRKERFPMLALARGALIVVFALGGTAGTALAAQTSQPDDALYPVKLMTEDLQLALATNPQTDLDLLLGWIAERVDEMAAMEAEGEPIPQRTAERLQMQLEQALQLASELDDHAMVQALEQIRVTTQQQIQRMEQLRLNASQANDEVLQLMQQNMNQIRVTAEQGIEDPTTLRQHQGTNRPDTAPEQPDNEPGKGEHMEGCLDCPPNQGGPNGTGNRERQGQP